MARVRVRVPVPLDAGAGGAPVEKFKNRPHLDFGLFSRGMVVRRLTGHTGQRKETADEVTAEDVVVRSGGCDRGDDAGGGGCCGGLPGTFAGARVVV